MLAFCGAGVSAESGLPTFRGAGGLWEGHRIEEVATPAAFQRDPALVWRFYAARQEQLQRVEPNSAHRALAAMEAHFDDFLLVTQNVDDLHERAGSRNPIKLHGSLMEVRCERCCRPEPLVAPVSLAAVEAGDLPRCECGRLLRPNVVWFGEVLNPLHLQRIGRFLERGADLLLVIGTSGEVSGGYGIAEYGSSAGARVVEINPHPSHLSAAADLVLRAPAAELLGRVWPLIDEGWAQR